MHKLIQQHLGVALASEQLHEQLAAILQSRLPKEVYKVIVPTGRPDCLDIKVLYESRRQPAEFRLILKNGVVERTGMIFGPEHRIVIRRAYEAAFMQQARTPGGQAMKETASDRRPKFEAIKCMTPEEWKRRYAARIVEKAGWDQESADAAAEVGLEIIDLDGYIKILTPEDEADEEMSYWD